jgi:2-polyprenyl-3-methyl-5-hydroxy-6-metoxy-1,4-benzoquinol methylase
MKTNDTLSEPGSLRRSRCIICGEQRRSSLYRPKNAPGPVVRCLSCGMIYIAPVEREQALIVEGPVLRGAHSSMLTSENLEDIVGTWEGTMLSEKEEERAALELNANETLAAIERFAAPPGRLLDFGCGWGFFLRSAARRGWQPYGVEPLPGPAIYARVLAGATVVTDTIHADTFPADFFDVITAFQVFEHIPDPNETLAMLRSFLRPNGIMLIEVPNIATWSVRLLGKRHRHYVQDHLNFFSAETLGQLFQANGLQPLLTHYPTRRMTVGHLRRWVQKLLPGPAAGWLGRIPGGMRDRIIPMKLGDIVTVIAQKA